MTVSSKQLSPDPVDPIANVAGHLHTGQSVDVTKLHEQILARENAKKKPKETDEQYNERMRQATRTAVQRCTAEFDLQTRLADETDKQAFEAATAEYEAAEANLEKALKGFGGLWERAQSAAELMEKAHAGADLALEVGSVTAEALGASATGPVGIAFLLAGLALPLFKPAGLVSAGDKVELTTGQSMVTGAAQSAPDIGQALGVSAEGAEGALHVLSGLKIIIAIGGLLGSSASMGELSNIDLQQLTTFRDLLMNFSGRASTIMINGAHITNVPDQTEIESSYEKVYAALRRRDAAKAQLDRASDPTHDHDKRGRVDRKFSSCVDRVETRLMTKTE